MIARLCTCVVSKSIVHFGRPSFHWLRIIIISSVGARHLDSEIETLVACTFVGWGPVPSWWHSIDLSNLKSFLIEFTRMRRPVFVCCCVSKWTWAYVNSHSNRIELSAQWSEVDVSQFQWGFLFERTNERTKKTHKIVHNWNVASEKIDWPFDAYVPSNIGNEYRRLIE